MIEGPGEGKEEKENTRNRKTNDKDVNKK